MTFITHLQHLQRLHPSILHPKGEEEYTSALQSFPLIRGKEIAELSQLLTRETGKAGDLKRKRESVWTPSHIARLFFETDWLGRPSYGLGFRRDRMTPMIMPASATAPTTTPMITAALGPAFTGGGTTSVAGTVGAG